MFCGGRINESLPTPKKCGIKPRPTCANDGVMPPVLPR